MPLSYVFRQTMQPPRRPIRRARVLLTFVWMVAALLTAGVRPERRSLLTWLMPSVLLLMVWQDNSSSRQPQGVIVGSLDDRAYLRYGREFDALDAARQQDLLKRYQVGTYRMLLKPTPAWAAEQHAGQEAARRDAHRILLWAAVPLATVYAAGWFLLDAGRLRAAWTQWPVVLLVGVAASLALPRLLWSWREPDVPVTKRYDLPDWPPAA